MSKLCTQNVRFRCTMDCPDSSDASADDHRKQKIITNDENSEFTGIYTIKKMQKTLAQVQLWDAKSLLRVVMWPGAHFFFQKLLEPRVMPRSKVRWPFDASVTFSISTDLILGPL